MKQKIIDLLIFIHAALFGIKRQELEEQKLEVIK
jgi:hypothetical protein